MKKVIGSFVVLLLPALAFGLAGEKKSEMETVEVLELREPAADDTSAIDRRIQMEEKTKGNPFSIEPHRPMYIMPGVYSSDPNTDVYRSFIREGEVKAVEAQFQISFKLLLWPRIFGDNVDLYAGYTQLNMWQVYNNDVSSPFRETNYQPELFFRARMNTHILGAKLRLTTLSFEHQSNGRTIPLSRSWNRIIVGIVMEKGHFYWNLRGWIRLAEDDKDNPLDPIGDDNPDILDFMGNGDLLVVFVPYRLPKHTVSVFFRPTLRSDFRAAFQAEWSFPTHLHKLRAYVQFFTGYGQSMIDYNHKQTRIGVGLMMTNWL